jgi:MFS family permease
VSRANRIRAVFFLHAIASGGIYSRVAAIQHNLGVDEQTLGLAFLGFPIGAILILFFGSRLVEIFGPKRIVTICLPLLPLGLTAVVAVPTPPLFFAVFLLFGFIYSLPNTAMNIEADRVEAATGRRVMNSCHGIWSIGQLLATLLGTLAEGAQLPPVLHMALLAVPLAPLALWVSLGIEPSAPRPHSGGTAVRRLAWPSLAVLVLVSFAIGPTLLEGALRNWSVIYMRDSFAAPSWVDTLTLPVFLTAHALGRLSADSLVTRFGVVPMARALTALALVGCMGVVLAPNLWVALCCFLLVGVGVCTSYPLTASAAARLGDRPSSENVASLSFATQTILLGAPALLGWIATNWGIRNVFAVLLPAVLVSLWLARYLAPRRGGEIAPEPAAQ